MPTNKSSEYLTHRSRTGLMAVFRPVPVRLKIFVARTLRVFIAEDSAHVLKALKSMLLSIEGVEVVGDSGHAAAALDAIRTVKPDVAILDLSLASGSGIDVLRALQTAPSPRPVRIVFTNQGEARWRSVCIDLGADYFFSKNADSKQLADLLRALVPA